MNDPSQDQPVQIDPLNSNVPNNQASDYSNQTPTTSSDDLFPPSSPGSTVRAMVGGRLVTTTLGVFLLVAGLAAGVVLVTQPQLLKQKASGLTYDVCGSGLSCSESQLVGGSMCSDPTHTYSWYCCPSNYTNVNGVCKPICGSGLDCSPTPVSGASYCTDTTNIANANFYCCPTGKAILNGACVTACTNTGNTGLLCTEGCPAGKAAYVYRSTNCTNYCNSGVNGANCTVTISSYMIIGSDNPNSTANSCDEVCGRQTSATKTSTCVSVGLNSAANDSKYKTVSNGACAISLGGSCGYQLQTLSRSCGGVKKESTKCRCMITTK